MVDELPLLGELESSAEDVSQHETLDDREKNLVEDDLGDPDPEASSAVRSAAASRRDAPFTDGFSERIDVGIVWVGPKQEVKSEEDERNTQLMRQALVSLTKSDKRGRKGALTPSLAPDSARIMLRMCAGTCFSAKRPCAMPAARTGSVGATQAPQTRASSCVNRVRDRVQYGGGHRRTKCKLGKSPQMMSLTRSRRQQGRRARMK